MLQLQREKEFINSWMSPIVWNEKQLQLLLLQLFNNSNTAPDLFFPLIFVSKTMQASRKRGPSYCTLGANFKISLIFGKKSNCFSLNYNCCLHFSAVCLLFDNSLFTFGNCLLTFWQLSVYFCQLFTFWQVISFDNKRSSLRSQYWKQDFWVIFQTLWPFLAKFSCCCSWFLQLELFVEWMVVMLSGRFQGLDWQHVSHGLRVNYIVYCWKHM